MSRRLSFSIAVNLLTENFKKGTNQVKNSLRSMQMQVLTFAAALGAGGLGISGLITRFRDVARETNRVLTALKNVSGGTKGFADNLNFLNNLANKYGLEINALVGNYAKFTASASQANMPLAQQKKIFESVSRAITAFSLSTSESDGVMLALSQMMSKGKISMEELRKQMGEKLPVAIQAMAKALGVSIGQMEKLIGTGKVMSADVLPKFADALNEIIPNVDTDNLETSLSRLSNVFGEVVDASDFTSKYKALIDGLTSLMQSALQNVQNIIVGVVAAIAFVTTKYTSKTLGSWWAMADGMTAKDKELKANLLKAELESTSAKKALDNARLNHYVATGKKKEALAAEVAKKEILYARAVVAEEKARLAHTRMAATQTASTWTRSLNMVKLGAAKLWLSIKSLWNSFAPALLISAFAALTTYIINAYNASKKLENITKDYNGEVEKERININILFNRLREATEGTEKYNKAKNEILSKYGEYLKGLSDEVRSLKDVEGAYRAISSAAIQAAKDRAISRGTEEATDDYIKIYKRNSISLKKHLESSFGKEKGTQVFDKIVDQLSQNNSVDSETQAIIDSLTKTMVVARGTAGVAETVTINDSQAAISQIISARKRMDKEVDEINSIFGKASTIGNEDAPTTPTGGDTPDLDDKALRAAEKRLEALRKLDEEDRKRQLEKQQFDIELQQKVIDLMDDSFEKRTKQTLLNLEKEKLAIEQHQADLLKQQSEHLKTKFISVHGTDKGFGEYFKKAQSNNFKDESGISILPEGLRPEDIETQVNQLLGAAIDAQRKGLSTINKDLSTMLMEQEVMFASNLERRLAETDAYYNAELIKAGENAELIKKIEENRKREKQTITTDDNLKRLDFEEQLKLEQTAGMESIGMVELVEEKKLEITKRYLQLRIDALQELADAGDEDAKRQLQLYQASLKKLNMQKPATSLKALADKAIFNTIKKGFESAGDSAEEAEGKTTKLMDSISEKAGMVANITSELQSMFGGMNEGLDEALSAIGNIAQGFATGGIVGGAMAVIGEGMKLFSKASEATARHQKALKEIEEARLASQRAYNLLLREQNLLLEEAVSIFGEKQITRAANAIQNYRDSIGDLQNEMQGAFRPDSARENQLQQLASSGGIMGAYFGKQLKDYQKQKDNYNKGVAKLAEQQIVTGHKKTGLFGWGKGKDTYSGILDVYPEIIKANGEIDKGALQVVLDTRKMSDETRNYLQNLINLTDAAEAAQEELKNYLQSTFGVLGDDIMNSIENAIRDKGINAWEDFGKAGAKVIEQLGKQIAYELFFADKFKKLQSDLEGVYGSNKSEADIARESMGLVGKFYQNIGKDMELAQGFMENWQKEAEKYGLELWNNESTSQSGSKGYSGSMDQDTGDKILGRITGIQMSVIQILSMVSGLSLDTANISKQTASMGAELATQTKILNNIYQVQRNSFYEVEGSGKNLKDMNSKLSNIEKYTKALE